MARYKRGRMALYEAMSKARQKPGFGRTLEKIRQQQAASAGTTEEQAKEPLGQAEATTAQDNAAAGQDDEKLGQWWSRRRLVQVDSGRLEFSVPYPLAVAGVLGAVVVLLLVYRLGQFSASGVKEGQANPTASGAMSRPGQKPAEPRQKGTTAKQAIASNPRTASAKNQATASSSSKNNVIVLAQYKRRADLVPVQAHFAQHGIETEIVNWGGHYFLITKERYDNPARPGTDGYKIRQKIAEIGAKYKGKAPQGYETFAPHFFSDAYGKKVE